MSLEEWFYQYDQSHQHPFNVEIHKVALGLCGPYGFSLIFLEGGAPPSF
jgi:hypothetical protein